MVDFGQGLGDLGSGKIFVGKLRYVGGVCLGGIGEVWFLNFYDLFLLVLDCGVYELNFYGIYVFNIEFI